MALSPDQRPLFKDGVMQPYEGGDAFGLDDGSTASPPPKAAAPESATANLPPLEVLEVGASFPDVPVLLPRPSEHVVEASAIAQPIALAGEGDGPKLATVVEMQGFIERVRALRTINPKPREEVIAALQLGLDVYNRTERTRLAFGLVSPVARAENLYELADRSAKNVQAVSVAASLVYQKPAQELARTFMTQVVSLLSQRNVSLGDPYISSVLAAAAEEAYYTMILDSTHLSRVDMERLYTPGEAKRLAPAEAQEKRKLTPAEKRAKMGFAPRKDDQTGESVEAPAASEAEPDEADAAEAVEGEYQKELSAAARSDFAAMIERVKPGQSDEKFRQFGRLKPVPPVAKKDDGNSLMAAYAAMAGEAPNYTTPQQALVYSVAEAMVVWCKGELDLLAHLKKDATLDNVLVDAAKAGERAAKLGERLPKMQQAERQNSEAVRAKLVEVSKLIAADKELLDSLQHNWRRDILLLIGTGIDRVVHEAPSVQGDVWRVAARARDERGESIRREQSHLRLHPDDIPGRNPG